MSLPTQLVHLTLAKQLLQATDKAAAALYIKRSEYIRQAIVEKLKNDQQPATVPKKPQDFDILMTDTQLNELLDVMLSERRRRQRRVYRGDVI